MKYLKIFESFKSDKLEEQIEDLFIGITDELGAGIQVVMDRFTNAGPRMERLQVKILLPHGYEHSPMDVYYKIRNESKNILKYLKKIMNRKIQLYSISNFINNDLIDFHLNYRQIYLSLSNYNDFYSLNKTLS
jgi:hypothetical protein